MSKSSLKITYLQKKMYKKLTLIYLVNTQIFSMRKKLTLNVRFDCHSNINLRIPNQCLCLSQLQWFLSHSQFCDYSIIKSQKKYLSLMLPPGDRNWQLINPNYTFLSKSSLKIAYLQKEMFSCQCYRYEMRTTEYKRILYFNHDAICGRGVFI